MAEDHFELVGKTLDGKYRVDAVVAQGGFGVVYRGEHLALRRPVAVKVLQHEASGPTAELIHAQFKAEATMLARLDHPAIVQVIDLGVGPMPSGVVAPWMVLEWVDGETLADALKRRAAAGEAGRAPAACFEVMRPVLEAVAQAHALGIAHRDLKPANIMLVDPAAAAPRSSARPMVRLLDFGIAKAMSADDLRPSEGDTDTRSGGLSAFSMRYAAPEQIGGARTGPWTDVHALGLILTQMLVGRPPYRGQDSVTVAAAALGSDRPTPASHGVGVGAWEPVLARALALRPADRPQDAGALLRELTAALPGATYTPAPSSDASLLRADGTLAHPETRHATEPILELLDDASAPSDAPVSRPQRSEPKPLLPRAHTAPLAAAGLALVVGAAWSLWPRAHARTVVAPSRAVDALVAPSRAVPSPGVATPSPAITTPSPAVVAAPLPVVVDAGAVVEERPAPRAPAAPSRSSGGERRAAGRARDAGAVHTTVVPVSIPWEAQ